MKDTYENANFCVCCGEIIPEGRMVCKSCEDGSYSAYKKDPGKRNKRDKKRGRGKRADLDLLDDAWY